MGARIQEIAEELVNLTVKEVNELAHLMNHGDMDMPQLDAESYRVYDSDIKRIKSPREYGESIRRRNWKKQKK